jgi:plasmid stabilization system protein ParE
VNTWIASPETDADLIAARDYIAADNDRAALDFLDAAFRSFETLAKSPEMGARARLKARQLRGVRYLVMPPPFNRWLVFYEPTDSGVWIRRVLCGNLNWRDDSARFF